MSENKEIKTTTMEQRDKLKKKMTQAAVVSVAVASVIKPDESAYAGCYCSGCETGCSGCSDGCGASSCKRECASNCSAGCVGHCVGCYSSCNASVYANV